MNIQVKGLTGLVIYAALGIVTYLILGTFSIFTWADPWLYVYMALWPLVWIWTFFVWAVIIAAIVIIGVVIHEKFFD